MNAELEKLYRITIAQKDNEIAALKARIMELENELLCFQGGVSAANQEHQPGTSSGLDPEV